MIEIDADLLQSLLLPFLCNCRPQLPLLQYRRRGKSHREQQCHNRNSNPRRRTLFIVGFFLCVGFSNSVGVWRLFLAFLLRPLLRKECVRFALFIVGFVICVGFSISVGASRLSLVVLLRPLCRKECVRCHIFFAKHVAVYLRRRPSSIRVVPGVYYALSSHRIWRGRSWRRDPVVSGWRGCHRRVTRAGLPELLAIVPNRELERGVNLCGFFVCVEPGSYDVLGRGTILPLHVHRVPLVLLLLLLRGIGLLREVCDGGFLLLSRRKN
mmetsp:Transcript_27308/g.68858  ORF Transcript_27308/g.68858 Transcript_27308/m.68858 type:complete len:268 (+) Transcript_27308:220-1023(+)